MKYFAVLGFLSLAFLSCQENESAKSDFTGNEATYALNPGSEYAIDGTVTFREKVDGTTVVTLQLNGTEAGMQHPVHLHLGALGTTNAAIAAQLVPVEGGTGKSETLLKQLADESNISYDQIVALDACIKVHLSASGPDKDIILAGGNIGSAYADDASSKLRFGVCKSE